MPKLDRFKKANDKIAFLLNDDIDQSFYTELMNLGNLKKEEREALVREIVAQKDHPDFNLLFIKLADLCFAEKGPAFIRGGSADFFGDLLYELTRQLDNGRFVRQYNTQTDKKYPDNYALESSLGFYFSLIRQIAEHVAEVKNDRDYGDKLGPNLANKIFNKLILDSASVTDVETAQSIQFAVRNEADLKQYFDRLIPRAPESSIVKDYFQQKAVASENKKLLYETTITRILDEIKTKKWEVGFNLGFFTIGGVKITIDGHEVRVSHRAADIFRLIDNYQNLPVKRDKDLYDLYEALKDKAEEGLDSPRKGQSASTREFYSNILDNTYRSMQEQPQAKDDDSGISLL